MMQAKGRLIGLGVGPGDPELITVKALRLLRESPVVAYFVAKGKKGNAFGIIEAHLQEAQNLLPLVYPVTTEALPAPLSYEQVISDFYDEAAETVASDTLEAMSDLATGIDIPITPTFNSLPGLPDTQVGAGGYGFDLAGLIDATAKAVLGSLNLQIVLNDGVLVPAILN